MITVTSFQDERGMYRYRATDGRVSIMSPIGYQTLEQLESIVRETCDDEVVFVHEGGSL